MNNTDKQRLIEIDKEIKRLLEEHESRNPFSKLKMLSNKDFGEKFSDKDVLDRCPNLFKDNSAGHDLRTLNGETWEVKSCRLPLKQITFNQCHIYECDKFLFLLYDTEEADVSIYLVPAKDIVKFSPSSQHVRGSLDCCTIGWRKKTRLEEEEKYRIQNFSQLNKIAGDELGENSF